MITRPPPETGGSQIGPQQAPGIPERAPEEAVLRVQVVQRRRPLDNLIGLFHGYASLLVLDAAGSDGVGLDALGGSLLGGSGDIGG